jgi:hypothetical protein
MRIEPGTLLVIETGGLSDYMFTGPFRVLKGFDQAEIAAAFRAQWTPDPDTRWRTVPAPGDFIPYLVREGYIEDVPCLSWHVGFHVRFEPDINGPPETKTDGRPA